MKTSNRGNLIRGIVIVLLACAVVFGVMTMPPSKEEQLAQRLERYIELRLIDDHVAIYDFIAPEQRQQLDLNTYVRYYGTGALKTHSIEIKEIDIDEDLGKAKAVVETDGELNLKRLPAGIQKTLKTPEPEALRTQMTHDLNWVWRDGDWYVLIEDTVVRGQDASGAPISPF